MTLLEIMIVIAIIGIELVCCAPAFAESRRQIWWKTPRIAAMLRRRASSRSGEQHRVVLDIEKGVYRIDVCQGAAALAREKR
jgi:hypothetical protein